MGKSTTDGTDGFTIKGKHALLETITLSGTAVGAAVGSVAGPVGAVAGAALGAAAGYVAGAAMEDEDRRHEAHERALDEAIGVEGGDLGAQEIARDSLTELQQTGPGAVLRRHHAHLERTCEELCDAYEEGNWTDVESNFAILETELLAHLDAEENEIFPLLREVEPAEVEALLADHRELRTLLEKIGIGIELKVVGEDLANAFIARLRAHAAREDNLAYKWADEHAPKSVVVDVEMALQARET